MAGVPGTQAKHQGTQEFKACIGLIAQPWVSDELLEELTICVEEALGAGAEKIAPGASASANFADRSIELDLTIEATPIEFHPLLGEVMRIVLEALEEHYAAQNPVSLGSSATAPVLVPA